MVIKGLIKGIPKNLPDLLEPCPIFLLTTATKIPIGPTIDVSKFSHGFMLQRNFKFFIVEIICGFISTFLHICYDAPYPFWFFFRSKRPPLDIFKFLVATLSNQYNKVTFIRLDEYSALSRSSEPMRTCHNMIIIFQNIGEDYSSLNGESIIRNKTLYNITIYLLLKLIHRK